MSTADAVRSAELDSYTRELFDELFAPGAKKSAVSERDIGEMRKELGSLRAVERTRPILAFFDRLLKTRRERGLSPSDLGVTREDLLALARRHEEIDEHEVTVGGRQIGRASCRERV